MQARSSEIYHITELRLLNNNSTLGKTNPEGTQQVNKDVNVLLSGAVKKSHLWIYLNTNANHFSVSENIDTNANSDVHKRHCCAFTL